MSALSTAEYLRTIGALDHEVPEHDVLRRLLLARDYDALGRALLPVALNVPANLMSRRKRRLKPSEFNPTVDHLVGELGRLIKNPVLLEAHNLAGYVYTCLFREAAAFLEFYRTRKSIKSLPSDKLVLDFRDNEDTEDGIYKSSKSVEAWEDRRKDQLGSLPDLTETYRALLDTCTHDERRVVHLCLDGEPVPPALEKKYRTIANARLRKRNRLVLPKCEPEMRGDPNKVTAPISLLRDVDPAKLLTYCVKNCIESAIVAMYREGNTPAQIERATGLQGVERRLSLIAGQALIM